ncbi:hypothetical protein ABID92_000443 [Frigoribacterium sp. PvP120]|uniref:hypothetical protein n=1 Tax=unclassified Frigoribacterium TaxID=2627005 RepID=UPI001AE7CB99|nr:hypothetical protein [Frigoribacterium sp. PvP121]MBP1241729.1 hypothetical protein [Frigoribacterium sp. PvP121]
MPRVAGRRHREMRDEEKSRWSQENRPCCICGMATIDWDAPANEPDAFELEHVLPVKTHPELEFEPSNRKPSHHRCNRAKGAGPIMPTIGTTSETW